MPAGFLKLLARCGGVEGPQAATLEAHCDLMLRWNRTINLTTITKPEEIVERHYCESVFLARALPERMISVVDIGSGAGFPGLVVAVMLPEASVTLVESHQRKAVFLKEATRDLRNVRVAARRAEQVSERFDWLVSRAVSAEDLGKVAAKLAEKVALLTGAESAPAWPGIEWQEAKQLPWGRGRFLRIGCFT